MNQEKIMNHVTFGSAGQVRIVNLTRHIVRLFPLSMAGRVLRAQAGKFFDPITEEEVPYLAFEPDASEDAVRVVTMAYEVEGWVEDSQRKGRVPIVRAWFRLHPPSWEEVGRSGENVRFIVPTTVITHACARWGEDHPFVAPLGGPFAVRDEEKNVVGTVALVHTVHIGSR